VSLVAIVQVLLVTGLLVVLLWVLGRAHVAASRRMEVAAERRLRAVQAGKADFVRSLRVIEYLRRPRVQISVPTSRCDSPQGRVYGKRGSHIGQSFAMGRQ
jgi:hypothetical protein